MTHGRIARHGLTRGRCFNRFRTLMDPLHPAPERAPDVHSGPPVESEINARDLLAAGWLEGRRFGPTLRRARELSSAGLSPTTLLAQLEQEFPKRVPLISPRPAPAPLAEAIEAETPLEAENLAATRARMLELLHAPVVQRGVIMPDACPSGPERATIPVGGAIEVANAIIPGAHSADICCSMFASFFSGTHPVGLMMDHLQGVTRFGAGGRAAHEQWSSPVLDELVWDNPFLTGLRGRAQEFLGTQGDGNHFAYVGRIQFTERQRHALERAGYTALAGEIERHDGKFNVLVTHHGSRGLGADVYKRGRIIARKWCEEHVRDIPVSAAWIPGDSREGLAYWEALQYVSRWTRANHGLIHDAVLRGLGQRPLVQIGNEHNFVWKRGDVFLHGKGATPAWRDSEGRPLLGLIPLNMATEILLVLGSDNADYLSFCPHGAGRNQSRSAMLDAFRDGEGRLDSGRVQQLLSEITRGLDIRWFGGIPDLSESPLGYKDAAKVKAQIARYGLAQLVGEVQPLGCLMAGEAPEPAWLTARREKKARQREDAAPRSDP
jgi:tRNA-splicing ligase RtcB (3'-phosphate/5'-hydroxy nucleic acid ligase)